ncbi:sulfite exporter TauE/SafE family protein [Nocardioides sp. HDW12B]|uniref:sulfite exporter TauE/SafE family protein n=1 Tax=Nocardioides sp. HDW12B TaxID=2714939 RepID=UPI00140AEDE8|nr:sulfite exporter TauE/SafE family protein [Nocardioides sp. HDW12B]QIK67845.1 sulfite exporter TauE/SafE family protein [Nocardioides sp. HDW12B]
MTSLALALVAGALIGLSLGALGGGGSILAVPVLVYLLDQSPAQATTGSLVVVGLTSLLAAATAHRQGTVLLARGLTFGVVAIGGAALGALASAHVPEPVLMAAFALLLLVVGGVMVTRLVRGRGSDRDTRPILDDPIITVSPTFFCNCPQALKVLVTATVVGLLTGFLGVGGGFLVVPALVLALKVPMTHAAGTSLVVITITSAAALVVRAGAGVQPDWGVVAALTVASVLAAVVGARVAARACPTQLSAAFTGLVLVVAAGTAAQALPAVV